MRKLLLFAGVGYLAFAASANAGSVTIGTLTVTQVNPFNLGTFDNNPIGLSAGFSQAITSAGVTTIGFTTDGAVENTTTGQHAIPAGDTSHYLYGINGANGLTSGMWGATDYSLGATVLFVTANHQSTVSVNSFYIYWGSIDAAAAPANRYDNILTLSNGDSVTGSNLEDAGALLNPAVNGLGDQFNANDNQWFLISDTRSFYGFNAQDSNSSPAFEFDMAVPEPSTWAMMGLGFAALSFAAYRRSGKSRVAIA